MKTDKQFPNYLIVEIGLFLVLFTFQILTIFNNQIVYDINSNFGYVLMYTQTLITLVSFTYVFLGYLLYNSRERNLDQLMVTYMFFILIGDVFFSLVRINLVGHIMFTLAYIVMYIYRKPKIYEIITTIIMMIIFMVVLIIMKKASLMFMIDSVLGAVLISNVIFYFVRYKQDKTKGCLMLGIACTLALVSDVSIALRTIYEARHGLNYFFSLITWPTYILANILICNEYYYKSIHEHVRKKEASE